VNRLALLSVIVFGRAWAELPANYEGEKMLDIIFSDDSRRRALRKCDS